jgi:hypothetical protein
MVIVITAESVGETHAADKREGTIGAEVWTDEGGGAVQTLRTMGRSATRHLKGFMPSPTDRTEAEGLRAGGLLIANRRS